MSSLSGIAALPNVLTWIFATIGLVHIAPPRALVSAYRRWGYSRSFPVFASAMNILTAVLIADPDNRVLGIAIAGMVLFSASVILLSQRHYVGALPGIALLVALPFAASTALESHHRAPLAPAVAIAGQVP
jgi:hypothetical protein